MQGSEEFLVSRAAPGLKITETFRQEGGAAEEQRAIPCTVREMHAAGWHVLPSPARLAQTGTTYGSPEKLGTDQIAVTLGPAEGTADARYVFHLVGGKWQLASLELYSFRASGANLPPLPCNPGHRPNNSSKPTPLRGAA
jgi:hypothetical protein